ncbi:MAG: exodeoxyribonuclease VII small subunit [Elusimicrobiota bacterium]|jgi:exodeoxyribonuclease VII small subunit|nr:exodeoxyribonuclease VII small subunit [Elusimicrobiota bacterium]
MTRKEFNFEKSIQKIEDIISKLENETTDLDKTLELFAQGTELVKLCSQKLTETKKKIEMITSYDVKEN